MELSATDRKKLLSQLDRLAEAVEDLLLTGLTTASGATTKVLGVTFQEASRLRLLRLSGTLRVANEELGRFTRNDTRFSQRRLVFFLNRAWLLSKGIVRALREDDATELDRLMWTPPVDEVDELNVVTLGVVKKVAVGAFCAFEFRLRSVEDGRSFVWSTVFPLKSGVEIPPEGFLHIPQKQKFTANVFLEGRVVQFRKIGVAGNEQGGGRIQLGEHSSVTAGEPFEEWEQYLTWDPTAAIQRIEHHQPGPFDLDIELQEDVVLADWELGDPEESTEDVTVYPIQQNGVVFDGRVSIGNEGKATRKALKELAKKKQRPTLLGVLHYESCRLVLQPLTVFPDEGPRYITISDESIDRKALLQTIKFT